MDKKYETIHQVTFWKNNLILQQISALLFGSIPQDPLTVLYRAEAGQLNCIFSEYIRSLQLVIFFI